MKKKLLAISVAFMGFICSVNSQTLAKPDSANFASINGAEVELPLIMKLNKSKKTLTYFGTYHTNQPGDSLFIHLENELKLQRPEMILFEGVEKPPLFANMDSTIIISGEPGYVIQYAKKNGIKYACIEPKESLEYDYLLSKFSKKEVVLFYLCRQIGNQQRREEGNQVSEKEFDYRMSGFLGYMNGRGLPLVGEELDFLYWKKEFKNLLGFPLEWRTMDNNIHYPNQFKTTLNEVSRASDTFRNTAMVETIFQSLAKSNNVFVLVGYGHLIIQEPLIRKKWSMLK